MTAKMMLRFAQRLPTRYARPPTPPSPLASPRGSSVVLRINEGANDVMNRIALHANKLTAFSFCVIIYLTQVLSSKKGVEIMKKFLSLALFILVIAVFIFELYCSIVGTIDIKKQLAELAANEASGHEILGVPLDIFAFVTAFVSIAGFIFAIISWKIAQYRIVKIVSGVMCPLYLLPIVISVIILML